MKKKIKKDENYYNFEIFKSEFDKSLLNPMKKKGLKKLYLYIKESYENQIKQGTFEIKYERIRIEKDLGKYYVISKEKANNLNGTIKIITTSMLTYGVINVIMGLDIPIFLKGGIITVILSVFLLMVMDGDLKSKHYEKDVVNSLSLIVLDELEEEINKEL